MRLFEQLDKIKSLEAMFFETKRAIAFYIKSCETYPTLIESSKFKKSTISSSLNEIENTFIVRIFAEFEGFLRNYWALSGRRTKPQAKQLINSIATRFQLDPKYIHKVREYRNSLLHEGAAPTITLTEARKYICTYLGQMQQPAILPHELL
jgi:hypothetical protein